MMESEVRDEVCDFDNLYRAMQHCKNNVMWKDSVAGYVKNGLVISIVENAGLMGINIPPAITSAIEVLKKKSDSVDNTDQ